jgi:hypothetical protein
VKRMRFPIQDQTRNGICGETEPEGPHVYDRRPLVGNLPLCPTMCFHGATPYSLRIGSIAAWISAALTKGPILT